MTRRTRVLAAAVACVLSVSTSAAGEAPSLVRVKLEAEAPTRVEGVGEVRAGGVLRLRLVESGTLQVRVGRQVVVDCDVLWGEAERMIFADLAWRPQLLPQVVSREPGSEEVEVLLPEQVESGEEEEVVVRYEWEGPHRGKPPLEMRWRLVIGEEQRRQQAQAQAFEEEFPLGEEAQGEREAEPGGEEASAQPEWLGAPAEAVRPRVEASQPEVLRVWAQASREEVAEQLFGEPEAVSGFDYEACEAPEESGVLESTCVRVRQVEALLPQVRAEVGQALEALLKQEEAWLRRWEPGEAQALAERSLAWAQRAEMKDEQGRSYFDRYLELVAARQKERDAEWEGEWDFLGEHSEQVQKAVALRAGQWETDYKVTDGVPRLKPGDVVGRSYSTLGIAPRRTSLAVRVLRLLVEERSAARAEIRLRNGPWRGLRVLVPGEDGLWRGYAVDLANLTEQDPLEQAGTRLYGYYKGTLFIRPGEWRPGVEGRGDGQEGLRQGLLDKALAGATAGDLEALLGLDHEVLGLLTAEQRQELLERVLSGPALTSAVAREVVELLARVVVSTPDEDFEALERALMRREVLNRLLSLEGPQQAVLGQAFTLKALAAAPLPLEHVEKLPNFHLGRQGEESYLLNVPLKEAEGGEVLLRFRPVEQRFEGRYLSSNEEGPTSRALRAREWVRVELHGPQPQTRVVTALELALRASDLESGLIWTAVGRLSEMYIVYGGVLGLARAPLVGAGAAARQAAVKAFAGRVGLVAMLATVDSYREELSRTEAGRNFLAVHDLALLGLAVRDVGKLVTSGVLREWARQGAVVLSQAGAKASAGLRESVEAVQALARAVDKVLAEGKAVATREGLVFSAPEGARALQHAWFSVRGEMAAERALAGLRKAGALTPEVERTLSALRSLGEQSEAWARAWSAVAGRAAKLPAQEAREYLEAVESLRKVARPAAQSAVVELLLGSGKMTRQAPGLFLKEAEWLVQRPGLEEEALNVLARKAANRRLDLRWLGSTNLVTEDLNFLARDERTPWKLLKAASEQPGNLQLQRQARRQLRGIAGELVTERSAQRLFAGYKVIARQVLLDDGHIIDFELQVLKAVVDGLVRHALEVKGWTADTWRRALEAWARAEAGTGLDKRQQQLIQQLERLIEQLRDAAMPPRGNPFLVCTDKLSRKTYMELEQFLKHNSLEVEIKSIKELEMVETTRRLRAALNLPEQLPGKEMGGTP